MSKVEKIKAEIDRLQETTMDENRNFLSSYHEGIFDGLSMIENFIDSLEEEPVNNDLEKACDEYYDETWDEHGGKAMVVDGYHDIWFPSQATDDFFKAGAEWQKEKMMEDAVDGEIYFSLDYQQYRINTEPLTHFHHGDKVKLIIIKEE